MGDEKKRRKRSRSSSADREHRSRSKLKKRKRSWQSRNASSSSSSDSSSSRSSSSSGGRKSKHRNKKSSKRREKSKSKKVKKKSKKRNTRKHRDSSSDSSSSRERKKKKTKKKKKKLKKEKKKLEKQKKEIPKLPPNIPTPAIETPKHISSNEAKIGPTPRVLKPMSKEEWEKQQSVTRHVYDPETGRNRLIKGDGEVIEEIVSRERHLEINKMSAMLDSQESIHSLPAEFSVCSHGFCSKWTTSLGPTSKHFCKSCTKKTQADIYYVTKISPQLFLTS